MNNNEKEILRNFKINIALSNFEREQKERNFLKNREKVKFIKKNNTNYLCRIYTNIWNSFCSK